MIQRVIHHRYKKHFHLEGKIQGFPTGLRMRWDEKLPIWLCKISIGSPFWSRFKRCYLYSMARRRPGLQPLGRRGASSKKEWPIDPQRLQKSKKTCNFEKFGSKKHQFRFISGYRSPGDHGGHHPHVLLGWWSRSFLCSSRKDIGIVTELMLLT